MQNNQDQNNQNDDTTNETISNIANEIFSGKIDENFLGLNAEHLENVAFHDFTEYQYVLEPTILVNPTGVIEDFSISQVIEDPEERLFLNDLKIRLEQLITDSASSDPLGSIFYDKDNVYLVIGRLINTLCATDAIIPSVDEHEFDALDVLVNLHKLALQYQPGYEKQFINWLPIVPQNILPLDHFHMIYDYLSVDPEDLDPSDIPWLNNYLTSIWIDIASLAHRVWTKRLLELLEEERERIISILNYPFEIYEPKSWNLGTRLIYRQEWRPLGNQRGEIVRTIPLGPKQVEKVSTKIIRRIKIARTAENLKSVEQTTEVSDTTKDSSEIVNEASKTFNWNFEAEASINIGSIFSAGISGGMEENSEKRSREANTHLSEAMQKTASKIRTETKTIVSTESESTFEIVTASEIENPNDEIAITYVYSKLQRQYEIFTSLAEVQDVIMIAEPIPYPFEINFDWVKRYDWIISKVLLDNSFRDALNSIGIDPKPIDYNEIAIKLDEKLGGVKQFFESFAGKIGTGGALSLSGVDIIESAQKNYQEAIQRKYENKRQLELINLKRERLYQHIRDNTLHYCRAIWSHEDPQQRLLRYKKQNIKILKEWEFKYQSEDKDTLEELLDQIILHETDPNQPTPLELEGEFVGNIDGELVDITDLINPAGPIGYMGNYAIYYIRPEFAGSDILNIYEILKRPYLYYKKEVIQGEENVISILMDPILKKYTQDRSGDIPDEDERSDMVRIIPELRVKYSLDKDSVTDNDFIEFYPEYLFRKEMSRKFLLDSNNLIIDIEPGKGTTLEPFKLAHRGTDVLKAFEEKKELELENKRREHLIEKQIYDSRYWPGAQKVMIFDTQYREKEEENETNEETTGNSHIGGISYGYPVVELGYLSEIAAQLENLGIETTIKLLQKCKTPKSRKKLLQALQIADIDILELANIADLMRIKGIGEAEAIMLEELGVDTVRKLARRNASNLYKTIDAYAKEKGISAPEEAQILKWIEEAKKLKPILNTN